MDALRADLAGLRGGRAAARRRAAARGGAQRDARARLRRLGLAGSLALLGALVVFLRRRVTAPIERVAGGRAAAGVGRERRARGGGRAARGGPARALLQPHERRAAAPRRGHRARARSPSREPGQERVPLAHEPRAAHAAERGARASRSCSQLDRARRRPARVTSSTSSAAAGTCSSSSTRCSTSADRDRARWRCRPSRSMLRDRSGDARRAASRPLAERARDRDARRHGDAADATCSPTTSASSRCC